MRIFKMRKYFAIATKAKWESIILIFGYQSTEFKAHQVEDFLFFIFFFFPSSFQSNCSELFSAELKTQLLGCLDDSAPNFISIIIGSNLHKLIIKLTWYYE